jgi:hypothetical protein
VEASNEKRIVQVPVPVDRLQEVYDLLARKSEPPTDEALGWDEKRVRQLAGHPNKDLRAFLRYLAERSPEWVPAGEAMEAVGKDPKSAGGFLGPLSRSSEKRYGLKLPIEDSRHPVEGQPQRRGRQPQHYRIPEATARLYLGASS